MITIKKYPNRRLYDTSKSQYINLEAIKELVMQHQEFEVVDSKTGENFTKNILLQIITEQENNEQQAVMTQTLLKQLIRFYGSDSQSVLRQYLERSLTMFLEQQDQLRTAVTGWMDMSSPMDALNKLVDSNLKWWRQFSPTSEDKSAKSEGPRPSDDSNHPSQKPE